MVIVFVSFSIFSIIGSNYSILFEGLALISPLFFIKSFLPDNIFGPLFSSSDQSNGVNNTSTNGINGTLSNGVDNTSDQRSSHSGNNLYRFTTNTVISVHEWDRYNGVNVKNTVEGLLSDLAVLDQWRSQSIITQGFYGMKTHIALFSLDFFFNSTAINHISQDDLNNFRNTHSTYERRYYNR